MSAILNNYYSSPNFRACKNVQNSVAQNQAIAANYNITTPQNFKGLDKDTVEISGKQKNEKQGMSKGAKWGIGLGLTALAGIGIYLATKGKVGTKPVKQLAEHVEFKEAKTVEEAKKFAEEKFGVYYQDIDDVGVINFYNEWITGLHNQCKVIDKSSYPKFIVNNAKSLNIGEPFAMTDGAIKYKGMEGYCMETNMPMFNDFKRSIDKLMHDSNVIQKDVNGKYIITDKAYQTGEFKDFIQRINNISSETTFKEKNRLITDLKGFSDGQIVDGQIQKRKYGDFYLCNHELGHMRHQECASNFKMMKKVEEFKELGQPASDITMDFVTDMKIQETAVKVSDYATESPLEFVAEVFAGLQDGRKFPDDVMMLYKKYNGPMVG